ncbi:MAG: hypothetical protein WCO25_05810 [Candidatus Uhrbacteria bacterium]
MGSEKSFYAFRQEQAKKFQVDKEWAEADLREALPGLMRRIDVVSQTAGDGGEEGSLVLSDGESFQNPLRETLPRVVASMLGKMTDGEAFFWMEDLPYGPNQEEQRFELATRFVDRVKSGDYFSIALGLLRLRASALEKVRWHREVLGSGAQDLGGRTTMTDESGIFPVEIETFKDPVRQKEHFEALATLRDIDLSIMQLDLSRVNPAFGVITTMVETAGSGMENAEDWTAAADKTCEIVSRTFAERGTDPLVVLSDALGIDIAELSRLPLEEQRSRLSKEIQVASRELHPDVAKRFDDDTDAEEQARAERYKKLVMAYSKIKTTSGLETYWKTFGWLLPAERLEPREASKKKE